MNSETTFDDIPMCEIAVIGCILNFGTKAVNEILDRDITQEYFTSNTARKVFRDGMNYYAKNNKIDTLSLGSYYQSAGVEEKYIEAVDYFSFQAPLSFEYMKSHLDDLIQAHVRHEAQHKAFAMIDELNTGDAKEVVAKYGDDLMQLARMSKVKKAPTVGEMVDRTIDHAEKIVAGEQDNWGIPIPNYEVQIGLKGWRPGIHVIGARTSMGKSTLEELIVCNALEHGKAVARVLLDQPPEDLIERFVSRRIHLPLSNWTKANLTEGKFKLMRLTRTAVEKMRYSVIGESDVDGMLRKARSIANGAGLDMLTIDYVQLCGRESSRDPAVERIGKVIKKLKDFSREYGVVMILLAQLNRDIEKDSDRDPRLSDLRDSGSLEQDADSVSLLYPDKIGYKRLNNSEYDAKKFREATVRPVIWDVAKFRDGCPFRTGIRMLSKHFTMEPASGDYGEWYYDKCHEVVPNDPYRIGEYIVAQDNDRNIEVFDSRNWLDIINSVAQETGQSTYEPINYITGLEPALAYRDKLQRELDSGEMFTGRQ